MCQILVRRANTRQANRRDFHTVLSTVDDAHHVWATSAHNMAESQDITYAYAP
jgi:hypothetical protein